MDTKPDLSNGRGTPDRFLSALHYFPESGNSYKLRLMLKPVAGRGRRSKPVDRFWRRRRDHAYGGVAQIDRQTVMGEIPVLEEDGGPAHPDSARMLRIAERYGRFAGARIRTRGRGVAMDRSGTTQATPATMATYDSCAAQEQPIRRS